MAAGVYPGFVETVTDSVAVFRIPNAARPTYLRTLIDPTFGMPVRRITGYVGSSFTALNGTGTWGDDARHHYSKDQPWNSDGTLLEVQNSGTPKHLLLDGETYQVLYNKCPSYIIDDDRWHPSLAHPHERINVHGTELMWYDVVACVKTRSWALPFVPVDIGDAEGNPSSDGRYLALNDSTRVFIVDMDPRSPYAPYPAQRIGRVYTVTDCGLGGNCKIKWTSVSPSGKYLVINYEGDRPRVYDINAATLDISPRPLPATALHCSDVDPAQGFVYDLGHADLASNPFDENEDVLIGQEQCGLRGKVVGGQLIGGVVMVRLRDGAVTSLTDPTNESYPHHISARNTNRPGWVYVGYWPYEGKRFADEVVAVRMDGSKAVQRFAHKHSAFVGCYRCESHAVPSGDGRRILWASNWDYRCTLCGDATDIKAYVADARDAQGNMIGNPSFEYSTYGWISHGGATVVRVPGGVDAFYGARVTGSATLAEFGINDSPNWVSATAAGARYRVTAWVRSTTGHGRCVLKLREYHAGAQVGATALSPALALTPEWQRMVVDIVAQAAGSSIDLQVTDYPAAAGEQFEIDDIALAPESSTTTTDVGAESRDMVLPATLAPNPLLASSLLEFATREEGPARVRIFDVNGRAVATLLDTPLLSAGTHRVSLGNLARERRLSSGIYFCRVDSPSGWATRRFVMLD